MARIVYSALVDSIKGSIKGTTFQANRYGFTIKGKPNQKNPNTLRQSQQKSRFAQYVQAWRALSQTDRDSWNSYATNFPVPSKHNPSANLNGFAYFSRYHGFRSKSALSILDNPSAAQGNVDFFSTTLILSGGDLFAQFDIGTVTGAWLLNIYLTRPLGATQNSLKGFLKFTDLVVQANFGSDNDITAEYENLFGVLPAVGERVGVRVVLWNTGNGQVQIIPNTIEVVST